MNKDKSDIGQNASSPVSPSEKDVLTAIKGFFEDGSLEPDFYSKENLGSESYIVPGQPCHGGNEDEDKDKP